MAAQLEPISIGHVLVDGAGVRIVDFVETDREVLRLFVEQEDPEEALHAVLRVGSQAVAVARTDFETHVVERRFEVMARTFDETVESAVERINDIGARLLEGDDALLPRLLDELKRSLAAVLEETFDEDSKTSAIAKMEAAFDGAAQRLDRNVRSTLDPDAPDSPLARTKKDILTTVKDQAAELHKEVRDVALAVAANKARADTVELTAIKGFSYEDLLDLGVSSVAAVHGDVAERVGTRPGAAGTKHGDLLVTLNAEDTCGLDARFVLECKDRRLGMAKTMEELEKALENHGATAAVAVFSRQELAPSPLPFSWSGNRAVLVYDKEDPDENALQLAYTWARWVCRRELTADATAVDMGRVEALLKRSRQALARQQAARACFTTAVKKIDEGTGHVTTLVEEVRAALSELWDELNAA